MKEFITYFFGHEDSKGRHYFPVKPGAFIFSICIILVPVFFFVYPPLAIFLCSGIGAPLLNGYMDYKMYKALNMTKKEKRERTLNNLLKFSK